MRRAFWILAIGAIALTTLASIVGRQIVSADADPGDLASLQHDQVILQQSNLALRHALAQGSTNVPRDFSQSELLQLRHEAGRWRNQDLSPELSRLQKENDRLRQELENGIQPPPRLRDLEGFVDRTAWAPAGRTTPQAALQTLLWSMHHGDLAVMLDTLVEDEVKDLEESIRDYQPAQVQSLFDELRRTTESDGYRVLSEHVKDENQVTLVFQLAAEGMKAEVNFVRQGAGAEWKAMSFPKPSRK